MTGMNMVATEASPPGINLQKVRNPHALAQSWLRHNNLTAARDIDDIKSDLLYGIARAIATYQPGDQTITRWCWICMDSEARTGRERRARYENRRVLAPDGDLDEPDWLRVTVTDPGFEQVEDRILLQRWADMAYLTDNQADLLAWMAVHAGTYAQRNGQAAGHKTLFHHLGGSSTMKAGLAKLRRVATTGKPWTPARGRQVQCGTESGYTMHRRRGEEACELCKAARREAYQRRKAAREAVAG